MYQTTATPRVFEKRIAIFFPFADIWTHQRITYLMARSLGADNKVTVIACDGERLSVCPAQRAVSLSEQSSKEERDHVCRRCIATTRLSKQFDYISLRDFSVILPPLPRNVQALKNYQFDGQPLGRTSLYDYLLAAKRAPSELGSDDLEAVRASVSDSVDIYLRLKTLFAESNFDLLIVNNELYAMNAAACSAARTANIPVLNVNLGVLRSQLDRSIFVTRSSDDYFFAHSTPQTPSTCEPTITPKFARDLESELEHRFFRKHSLTYSSRASRHRIRRGEEIKTKRFRSTLLLSSPDELETYFFVKGLGDIDADQARLVSEFLRLANASPSLNFHIRMHPRMGRNRREATQAESRKSLERQLATVPANVQISLPETTQPILDVLRDSETVVVSWSSVGLDAATIGVPVIFGIPGQPTSYPRNVGLGVDEISLEELARVVELGIQHGSRSGQIRALEFWSNLWNDHSYARALPINFSPALLLLALSHRTRFKASTRLHSMLRRLELSITPGFRESPISNYSGVISDKANFQPDFPGQALSEPYSVRNIVENRKRLEALIQDLHRLFG